MNWDEVRDKVSILISMLDDAGVMMYDVYEALELSSQQARMLGLEWLVDKFEGDDNDEV